MRRSRRSTGTLQQQAEQHGLALFLQGTQAGAAAPHRGRRGSQTDEMACQHQRCCLPSCPHPIHGLCPLALGPCQS